MRYKLIDSHTILQVTNVTDETQGLITNAPDDVIDSHNAGKPLDDTAAIPTYNPDTQYIQTVYTETDTAVVKGYEVMEFVPSETDTLKKQCRNLEETLIDMTITVWNT